jgi:GT2 family glycosyltransferase
MGNCLDIFLGQIDIPNQIEIIYQLFRSDRYQVVIHYSNGKIENKLLTNQDLLINLVSKFHIEVINNNTNIGLGAAYNFVFKKHFVGFDYFVTLDQDTLLPNIIKRIR